MTYKEQLVSPKWKKKRKEILSRDKHKCQHCFNEKLIDELEDGLFLNYPFPDKKNIIDTYNLGKERFKRIGTKNEHINLIKQNVIFYSRKFLKRKRIIFGIRNFNEVENNVFHFYENKIAKLKNNREIYNLSNLRNYARLVMDIDEERRIVFIELKKDNDHLKFDWKLMLGLHIHHKYYVEGLMAWEYPESALTTLCHYCHEKLHQNERVPVHGMDYNFLGYYYTNCSKCDGKGYLSQYYYYQNGICFKCNGAKYEELIDKGNTEND